MLLVWLSTELWLSRAHCNLSCWSPQIQTMHQAPELDGCRQAHISHLGRACCQAQHCACSTAARYGRAASDGHETQQTTCKAETPKGACTLMAIIASPVAGCLHHAIKVKQAEQETHHHPIGRRLHAQNGRVQPDPIPSGHVPAQSGQQARSADRDIRPHSAMHAAADSPEQLYSNAQGVPMWGA